MSTQSPFEETISKFRAELAELVKRRNEITMRMSQLKTAITGMALACEDEKKRDAYLEDIRRLTSEMGFVEAVRASLAVNSTGLSATEIRDFVLKQGWMDFSAYTNPLASIHTTLRRMKESGGIEEVNGKFRLAVPHPLDRLKPRRTKGGSGVIGKGVMAYLLRNAEGREKK
jgi:hypothetical protein